MRKFVVAIALAGLIACASPQTARPRIDAAALANQEQQLIRYALETRTAEYQRVYSIAERLRAANVELCPEKERSIGIMFETANDYGREYRDAAKDLWGLDDRPSVIWVGENSPAAAAGVRVRDRLIRINDEQIRPGRRASQEAFRRLRQAARSGIVRLDLLRGTEGVAVSITPVERCGYDFLMSDAADINAYADGNTIIITRGMLRFTRNEQELALVLAHELSHNAMRHIQAMQQNRLAGAVGGAVLDVLAAAAGVNTGGAFSNAGGDLGAQMFSQEFESEADYVGMYFLTRTGYSTDGVEDFWRRMAVENPRGVRLAYSHPTYAQRFLMLPAVRQEIADKAAGSIPLTPNMSSERARPPQTAPAP